MAVDVELDVVLDVVVEFERGVELLVVFTTVLFDYAVVFDIVVLLFVVFV